MGPTRTPGVPVRAGRRPAVSVIVPFAGGAAQALALLDAIAPLELRQDDELILVDNSLRGALAAASGRLEPPARVVRARERRASYYARNVGARAALDQWLLFLDADCRPSPTLLDDYFVAPIASATGAVGGAINPAPAEGVLARYARSRRYLDQAEFAQDPRRPFAATANLLVRRSAWAQVGGFREVRSGGDVDFCWRLQETGWSLGFRPGAVVEHRHRERLGRLVRQRVRYAAGDSWLAARHPALRSRVRATRGIARSLLSALGCTLRGRREAALFSALDALSFAAYAVGRRLPNDAAAWPRGGRKRP